MLRDLAPAKINLFLHVLGRRADGYHLLESLVGFADAGDELTLEPGEGLSLTIDGSMSGALVAEDDNLVLRAAHLFAEAFPGAAKGRFHLVKNLPIASGIGGGSSDAAAALRLLARANGVDPTDSRGTDSRVMACARALGADVPVCVEGKPRLMRGIGHDLGPALEFVELPALLVNPGVAVETRAVFDRLGLAPGARFAPPAMAVPDAGESSATEDPVARLTHATRNDLEPPAMALTSKIDRVLSALRGEPGCRLARMSGSGATCFALFGSEAEAIRAAESIRAIHYHWWFRPCRIQMPL